MNKRAALTQSNAWTGVVLVAIIFFLAVAPSASAAPAAAPLLQTPERITFAPGMMSAVRYGQVDLATPKDYVIHALAGQQMLVSIYSGGNEANFAITGVDDGQPYKRVVNEDRTFALTLPATQDYLITVQSVTPVDYTLAVIIPPLVTPPPSPSPVRIRFARGATSATVEGALNPPARDEYVIKALAGQQMTVEIASAGDAANFAITGVSDGQPYKRLVNEDRTFTFTLPRTQDYRITVASVTPVDYTLTITIPPLATSTPAPHPQRIRFARGAISATVHGTIAGSERDEYVLRALAGQQMTVEITSAGDAANFAITGVKDGQPYKRLVNEDRTFTFTLPRTQDYLITVASVTPVDYTLTVTIPPRATATPVPHPQRIRFARGAISATVHGTIAGSERDEYVLRALAGQQMTVEITSAGDAANFAITGVKDGQPYKRLVNEDRTFTFTLPRTQDYRITVASVTPVDYTLTVTIP